MSRVCCLFIALCFVLPGVQAQNPLHYDRDYLPPAFHKSRRDSIRSFLPDSSMAILFAAPERNRANDVDYEYHPDPNFYYLTGYREPHSVLLIFKSEVELLGVQSNEFIFVQDRNPAAERWNGRRLGKEGVKEKLGFDAVFLSKDFDSVRFDPGKIRYIFQAPWPKGLVNQQGKSDLFDLVNQYKAKAGLEPAVPPVAGKKKKKTGPPNFQVDMQRMPVWMATLREVKTIEELILLRKAVDMTCQAQMELMKALTPGMTEYQSEAIVEYVFKKNGSEHPGFPSIVGGGENSCVLHYVTNRRQLFDGDLLVVDIGAEYHGYTADVTRTMPVDGTFSPEEKIIYELVLKAQQAGIDAARKDSLFMAPHFAALKVIREGLMELGIIRDGKDVSRYFMHGTSHYLGLDVHDAGRYGKLAPGNVITVEPGIYIAAGSDCDPKWWNIGVRIEDDVLILEEGNEVMSISAPRTVEAIETLMKEPGNFPPSKP